MVTEVKKYKLVRRGPRWCVRVKGMINTTESFKWCSERNMSYHIKQHWHIGRTWNEPYYTPTDWDYSFIFEKDYEATAFILGYL